MTKETPEQEAERLYPYDQSLELNSNARGVDQELTDMQRSAHITAARMYMGEVKKYRKALEDIREIKSIDYACYQKTQAIISETLK